MSFKERRKRKKEIRERIYRPRTRAELTALRRANVQAFITILTLFLIVFICAIVLLFHHAVKEPSQSENFSDTSEEVKPSCFTIILDPGHGGTDNGNIIDSQTYESDYVMAIAEKVREILSSDEDYEVIFTRDINEEQTLSDKDRIAICEAETADCLISLHTCKSSARYSLLSDTTERSALLAQCCGTPEAESEDNITRISGMPSILLGLSADKSISENADIVVNGILTYRQRLGS